MAKKKAVKKSAKKKPAKKAAKKKAKAGWRKPVKSLADVRKNIDRLDDIIAPLICQRHYYVTQAAPFKPSVAGVVVPSRIEEIIERVRKVAVKFQADPATIEFVYRSMIDAFTADEQRHWRELHGDKNA